MPLATRAHANRGRGPMSVPGQFSWYLGNKGNFTFTGATQSMDTGQGVTSLNGVTFTCAPSAKDGIQTLKAAGTAYCVTTAAASEMICYMRSLMRWDDTGATTNRISAILNAWTTNNAGTADSATHYGFGYTSAGGLPGTLYPAVVQLVTNGGGFATIGGTWSEAGAGLGNWFVIEWVINPSNNTWVGRMPDGTTRTFTDANLTAAGYQGVYPSWEPFYGGGFTTGDVDAELLLMKASTLAAMTAPNKRYCNKLLRRHQAGEIAPVPPPTQIAVGTPLVDLFNRADTATGDDTAMGTGYVRTGLRPMRVVNNAAAAGSFNNNDCANARTDYEFGSVNQRCEYLLTSIGPDPAWPMYPAVRADITGKSIWAYISNNTNVVFYNSTTSHSQTGSTQRGTGGTSPTTTTMANGTTWSLEVIGKATDGNGDSIYIIRQNGVLWHSWTDTDTATFTGTGKMPVVSSYSSNANNGQINTATWTNLGDSAFLDCQMNKSATQSFTTAYAQVTGWTATQVALGAGERTSFVASNALVLTGTRNSVTISASLPYTGNTGGRSLQCRIKQNGTVIATQAVALTTTTGTLTASATVNVAMGDTITVEIIANTNATNSGTITSGTGLVQAVQ